MTSCLQLQPRAATIRGKPFSPRKTMTGMFKMPRSTSSSRVFKKSNKRAKTMLQVRSRTQRIILRYLIWKDRSHPRYERSHQQMRMRSSSMWSSVTARSASEISLCGRSIARSARDVCALSIIIAHGLGTVSENGIANLSSCFWSIKQLRYYGLQQSYQALLLIALNTSTRTGFLTFNSMHCSSYRY